MVFPAQFWKLLPIEIWSFLACVLSCWVSKFFWRGLLGGRLWACRVPGSSLAAVYRKRAPNFQKGPFFVACRKKAGSNSLGGCGSSASQIEPKSVQIGSEPILKIHLKKAILFFDVKNNVFEEKRSKKIRRNKHRCSIFAAIYSTLGHLYSKAFKATWGKSEPKCCK